MTTKQQDSWADDSSSDDESVEQPPQPQSTEDNQNDQQHLEETREQNNEDQQYRQQKPKREYREKRYPDEGERDKYQAPDSVFSIHVSNLSFAATDEDLLNFFTGGGCNVAEAHVYRDGYKSRGYGVVIFNDEESFKKSFEAHGFTFMDRQMNVKEKVPKSGGYNNNRSQGRGDGRRDGRRDREVNKDRENYKDREGYKRDGQKDVRNRDDRRGRGAGRGDSSQKPSSAETSEVPATRPKVVVADRTLPIEKVGEFVGSNSGIFGAAKARDEHIFEEKKKKDVPGEGEKTEVSPAPEIPPVSAEESLPAPPVPAEKVRSPKQYRNQNEFSQKRGGPRPEKREGGRGESGRDESGRGRGRGDKPHAGRGGRGRGEYRKKDEAATTNEAKAKKVEKVAENEEDAALARFQNAQEKMIKKEQLLRAQESRKGDKQIVNTFGALQLDDSDEDA